ncbi:hypothetical protein PABG_11020 [Paracoccidioides brasiliensis Pb03]|nr:hypothetical protein PABG_11020 [Paracoccidioides brasiliensis Pb03]
MGLIISQRAAGRKQMVKLCRLQTWRARRVLDYAGSMVQPPSHGKLWEDLGKHYMERFHVLVSKVEKFATLLKETLNKRSYSYNVYMHGSSVSRSGSKNPAKNSERRSVISLLTVVDKFSLLLAAIVHIHSWIFNPTATSTGR